MPDGFLRYKRCGHGAGGWMGEDDSTLSNIWCDECEDMIPIVRAGWALGLSESRNI